MTSVLGPYNQTAGVLLRRTNFIDLLIPNLDPAVTAYRVWGAGVLNDAYGDPDSGSVGGVEAGRKVLFEVSRDRMYASKSCRKMNYAVENFNRHSRALFNPRDFWAAANPQPLPLDEEMLYLRVQQERNGVWQTITGAVNTGDPILGPIIPVPAGEFYANPNSSISLKGVAPAVSTAALGTTPVAALNTDQQTDAPVMALHLPVPVSQMWVTNNDALNPLFVSLGWGMPFMSIPKATTQELPGGTNKILLSGGANAVSYSIVLATQFRSQSL